MKLKKLFNLYLTAAISIFAVACTVSAPTGNNEDEEISSSSCSAASSSSSTKKISSSSTAQSSSSVKISSSSFTEKSSSSKATSSSSAGKIFSSSNESSSSSQAKSSSSTKAISSSSVASSSSVEVKSIYEAVQESGKYTTRDSVAAYLCKFDKLPTNYVTQNEGKSLYESKTGNTFEKWNFNPWTTIGVMIGGDKFANNEGLLPKGTYHEADIDYSAKNRGTKRLVYQSDCVIYYTADHYKSFSKLEIQ